MYRNDEFDQEVPFIYPEDLPSLTHEERLSDYKKDDDFNEKFILCEAMDKVDFDTNDLFQDLSQMQEHWMRAAQSTKEDQFVPEGTEANKAEITKNKKFVNTEYGPVQIKIEEEATTDSSYIAHCCMAKNESNENKSFRPLNLIIPGDHSSSPGNLSPCNLNLNLLSSEPEENYNSPSPYNQSYIETASSPVYPRFIDRPSPTVSPLPSAFSKPDINNNDANKSNSVTRSPIYDSHHTNERTYLTPNQRLSHGFPLSAVKVEPIDGACGEEQGFPTIKYPSQEEYNTSRYTNRFKQRYRYQDRFDTYKEHYEVTHSRSPYHRRGTLQLWQFLVALLAEKDCQQYIAWVGRGLEFKLVDPEEVARRWGIQKNRPAMNYDKLSRSLRYYYEKGIMQKVAGERYVYRFVCNPEALFSLAFPDGMRPFLKPQCSQPQKVTDQQLLAGTREHYSVPQYIPTSRLAENWPKTNENFNCQ